MGKYENSLI